MAERVVLYKEDLGIYLGEAMGFAFWSLLDTVGQGVAVTFESIDAAADYVEDRWDGDLMENTSLKLIQCAGTHATPDELKAIGLGHALADMESNYAKMQTKH